MTQRLEFRLDLHRPSGVYTSATGQEQYLRWRTVRNTKAIALLGPGLPPRHFPHRWSDGYAATVTVRVMKPGERRGKTLGFWGYDWMIDNILRYGTTEKP